MSDQEKPKRIRIRKPVVKSEPLASLPDEPCPVLPANPSQCPPEDPTRGEKTPERILWNSRNRREEMEMIYRGWDWRAYLAANPPA